MKFVLFILCFLLSKIIFCQGDTLNKKNFFSGNWNFSDSLIKSGRFKIHKDAVQDFDLGKANLRSGFRLWLDTLAGFLKDNLKLRMIIEVHTDARSSDKSNLILSKGRADSIVMYLVKKGINKNRLTSIGCGEQEWDKRMISHYEDMRTDHNRRTEFIFWKKD